MPQDLETRVEARLAQEASADDAMLVAEHQKTIAEADPYNQLVSLVVREALDVKKWLIKRNEAEQRGWLIGDLLLRRGQPELGLTDGYLSEWSSIYYVGIETPPVGRDSDPDISYGWTFELRHRVSDAPRAFFSETDANRPEHYWARYGGSPVYVNRVATSQAKPEIEEKELWYTILDDAKTSLVISEKQIDPEKAQREYEYFHGDTEACLAVEQDYPELEAIRNTACEKIGSLKEGDDPFIHSLRRVILIHKLEEKFDRTPRGQERQKRLDEIHRKRQLNEEKNGPYYRAGTDALQHCLGLIAIAKKELKIKT